MPSHLENPFRPPIPTVVDYEKEAHAIGLLLGPKAEAAYRKRHAHDLSDPSASVSSGLTPEEQAQMNEKPKETRKSPEQIRAAWWKFFADSGLENAKQLMDSVEIHEDGSVSLTGTMSLGQFEESPPIFPTKIRELSGSLSLHRLKSAEHLVLPTMIGSVLDLRELTSAEHLVLPASITRSLFLMGLTSAEHLVLPKFVGHFIYFGGGTLPESDLELLRSTRPDLASKMKYK